MAWKGFVGCCCCCKMRSLPYIKNCSIFLLSMACIKIFFFILNCLFNGYTTAILGLYSTMIVFNFIIGIFCIILLSKGKEQKFGLVKGLGIFFAIYYALEMILLITLFALNIQIINMVGQAVADSHGDAAGAIAHVATSLTIIPILMELGILSGFGIWQIYAGSQLITCGSYNINKIEKGLPESPSNTSNSSDSDKERKKRKKRKKQMRNQYQGYPNQQSQNIQYANFGTNPQNGQNPMPVNNPPPPGYNPNPYTQNQPFPGQNPPLPGQNPPLPGQNPYPPSPNPYTNPQGNLGNPLPPYGTHAQQPANNLPPQPPRPNPNNGGQYGI